MLKDLRAKSDGFEIDLALSFAGEDRLLVDAIACDLAISGASTQLGQLVEYFLFWPNL